MSLTKLAELNRIVWEHGPWEPTHGPAVALRQGRVSPLFLPGPPLRHCLQKQ